MLNVIKYEDLRDIVLIGHSYGGMVATGVADRARDKVRQLIYVDAFVPGDGQSLLDLNQAAWRGCRSWKVRRLARAAEPDAARYVACRCRMASTRRVDMPIKCFETRLKLQGGPLTRAAKPHLRHAHHAGRYVRTVRRNDEERSAWSYYEIDASHSPNVTAPEALMALLQKIAA